MRSWRFAESQKFVLLLPKTSFGKGPQIGSSEGTPVRALALEAPRQKRQEIDVLSYNLTLLQLRRSLLDSCFHVTETNDTSP